MSEITTDIYLKKNNKIELKELKKYLNGLKKERSDNYYDWSKESIDQITKIELDKNKYLSNNNENYIFLYKCYTHYNGQFLKAFKYYKLNIICHYQ